MKRILFIILFLSSVCYGAIDFEADNTDYLYRETAAVTAYSFTMACWFKSENDTISQTLMWVGDKDDNVDFCCLFARGDQPGDPIRAFSHNYDGGSTGSADTSSAFTAGTWHHGCAVFVGVSERHAYLDGGSKGTNTNTVGAIADHDATAIGYSYDSSPSSPMDGVIAEAAIWSAELTDAEIAILAKGYSPLLIRPESLVSYTPLIRGYEDWVDGTTWTEGAAPEGPVAHCRVIYPTECSFGQAMTPPVVYLAKGSIFLYTAANWGSPDIYFEAYLRATSGNVHIDLYDITSSASVANSNLIETSTTFTRNRSAALTLTDGHEYRARVGKSGTDAGEYLGAKLIFIE